MCQLLDKCTLGTALLDKCTKNDAQANQNLEHREKQIFIISSNFLPISIKLRADFFVGLSSSNPLFQLSSNRLPATLHNFDSAPPSISVRIRFKPRFFNSGISLLSDCTRMVMNLSIDSFYLLTFWFLWCRCVGRGFAFCDANMQSSP